MAEREVEKERERQRERKRKKGNRGNYLIEKNVDREKFRVFFRLCHFFAVNKTFYPLRKTLPGEKFDKNIF